MQANQHIHNTLEAKVFTKGTIRLPVALRNELGIHDGDKVLFIRNGDVWTLTTHLNNIYSSQEYIRSLRQKDSSSIVDSLIEDRRKEAKTEFGK